MELLNHFNIAPGQLMPNSWRIIVSCMEIWLESIEGDMIRVEFAYLYRLKESKETGTTSLCPGTGRLGSSLTYPRPSDTGSPSFSLCLGMIGRPFLTKLGVTSLGYFVSGEP